MALTDAERKRKSRENHKKAKISLQHRPILIFLADDATIYPCKIANKNNSLLGEDWVGEYNNHCVLEIHGYHCNNEDDPSSSGSDDESYDSRFAPEDEPGNTHDNLRMEEDMLHDEFNPLSPIADTDSGVTDDPLHAIGLLMIKCLQEENVTIPKICFAKRSNFHACLNNKRLKKKMSNFIYHNFSFVFQPGYHVMDDNEACFTEKQLPFFRDLRNRGRTAVYPPISLSTELYDKYKMKDILGDFGMPWGVAKFPDPELKRGWKHKSGWTRIWKKFATRCTPKDMDTGDLKGLVLKPRNGSCRDGVITLEKKGDGKLEASWAVGGERVVLETPSHAFPDKGDKAHHYYVEAYLPCASESEHRFFVTPSRTGFKVLYNVTATTDREGTLTIHSQLRLGDNVQDKYNQKDNKYFKDIGASIGEMFRKRSGCKLADDNPDNHNNPYFTPGLVLRVDVFPNLPQKKGGFGTAQKFFVNEFYLVPLDTTFLQNAIDDGNDTDAANRLAKAFIKTITDFYEQPNQFPA